MGDGGLAVGTAILCHNKYKNILPMKLNNVYLGPKYKNKDIIKTIRKAKLKYIKIKNPEKYIAKKLHDGLVVACFQGRMEFGPRALGNRSILVNATDKSVNEWLNKKLKRTEFMPFAPITLKKYSSLMYKKQNNKKKSLDYMTATTDCKKSIKIIPSSCAR